MPTTADFLSGAWNFRDVADEAGIRPGRFYRSSELSGLDDAGRRALLGLGINDVVDLRSVGEVERRGPGQVPAGVAIHHLPFHELAAGHPGQGGRSDGTADAPHEHAFGRMVTGKPTGEDVSVAAKRFMTAEYRRFPSLPGAHLAVRQVISLIAEGRPVIAHCFAGKDRTGFMVAVVLEAIGMSRDAILADFLRSNDAVLRLREGILESIRNRASATSTPEIVAFAEARLTDAVLGVSEEYLDASQETIDREYGSLTNYLAALGVTSDQVSRLRSNLLG